MATRMTHPVHGVTHAVGSEIDWNIKNGWKVDDESPVEKRLDDVGLSEDLTTQYIAKFGKPPHHKMKEATIRAKLKE